MTYQEAIETLRAHNAWRRYDGPIGEGPEMVSPKELGEAIDVVCDALESRNKRARKLTWKSVNDKPKTTDNITVLLAEFDGNALCRVSLGWFFSDPDGDGFFAPNKGIKCTHWMPYDEYWKFMRQLPKE